MLKIKFANISIFVKMYKFKKFSPKSINLRNFSKFANFTIFRDRAKPNKIGITHIVSDQTSRATIITWHNRQGGFTRQGVQCQDEQVHKIP